MNELKNILEQNLNDNFISAVLSNPRDEKLSAKVKVRPVLMKDTRVYQMETFRGNQAFHENLSADEAVSYTHLDVYKRQSMKTPEQLRKEIL